MHTPEQAKALWCPMARIGVLPQAGGPSSCNDPSTTTFTGRCIADQCAMWRWEPTTESVPVVHDRDSGKSFTTYEQKTVRTHGYCGLAGNPAGAA